MITMKTDTGYRKKCRRYNVPGHAHGLTFSCYMNRPFLESNRARHYFIHAVKRARMAHRFDLWAWVIMPDHVHLLVYPRVGNHSISPILKSIKQSVSRRFILHLRKNDPKGLLLLETSYESPRYRFWQPGGGHDRNIHTHDGLIELVNYIHNNPVKSGLVAEPEDWPWSSARAWILEDDDPIGINKESFPST